MSIKIQVAICTQCNGYYSAAPLHKIHSQDPEIIDHFFYHGEPWFTLDQKTFEKFTNYDNIKVKVVDFQEHVKHDQLYCTCKKKMQIKNTSPNQHIKNTVSTAEKYELENELYFQDLYYTYHNFHAMNQTMNNNASNRKVYF